VPPSASSEPGPPEVHGGATAESLDCLAIVASRQQRWTDAALALAASDDIRARGRIHRSVLMSSLIDDVEAALSSKLSSAELREVRREGRSADLVRLAAEETARLTR